MGCAIGARLLVWRWCFVEEEMGHERKGQGVGRSKGMKSSF